MIASKLKTAGDLPITLAEAKKQLNIETAFIDDDGQITSFINAATNYFFNRTGRQLMQANWLLVLSDWCFVNSSDYLELPVAPLVKVVSVQYYDTNNTLQTLSPSAYLVNTYKEPGFIQFIGNLPDVFDRTDAIIIETIAGYGADGSNVAAQQAAVPEEWKQVIKLLLTDFYEYRGENSGIAISRINKSVDILMSEARIFTTIFFTHE